MKVLGTEYLVTWCLYRRGNCTARYWSAPEIENILVNINMVSTESFLHVAIDGNKHILYICNYVWGGVIFKEQNRHSAKCANLFCFRTPIKNFSF